MRTRQSSLQSTQPFPAAALEAWGFGPKETTPLPKTAVTKAAPNRALQTLLGWGLGLASLLLLWSVLTGAVARFGQPASTQAGDPSTRLDPQATLGSNPTASTQAPIHVERALPVLKRALPVYGAHYPATLPDGQLVLTTWKGTVADFSSLPRTPELGDEFGVKQGQGTSWIWATPLGWSHPAWIDP